MAQNRNVSTPASQAAQSNASPGTWTHPQFDEIQRRLSASTFNSDNIRIITINALAFLLSVLIPSYTNSSATFSTFLQGVYGLIAINITRVYFISRVVYALSPLFGPRDDLADIPLTPTQRALLGLGPSMKPTTPGSTFVTPPRYSRSGTPRSDSQSRSGSAYSGSPSAGLSTGAGSISYSPSASPLFQKAVGRDITRRLSYGTPSPLGQSRGLALHDSSNSFMPSTPSPTTNKGGPSVALNSRWLYERDRSSPFARSIYS